MCRYRTVFGDGCAEYVTEKSKFIGYVRGISSREEADVFFNEIRSLHKSATHCVPAFSAGERAELLWASDDREPQGTAGAPVLAVLSGEQITNVAVVIVRYFGGVKLGTGGLARAYTKATKLAIEDAGIAVVEEHVIIQYEVKYEFSEKLKSSLMQSKFTIENVEYSESVRFTVQAQVDNELRLRSLVDEATSGSAAIISETRRDIKRLVE